MNESGNFEESVLIGVSRGRLQIQNIAIISVLWLEGLE